MEHTDTLGALSAGLADAVETIGPAVVRVNGRRRRSGTGVVYGPNTVLTASHVLEREEDLTVGLRDGRTLSARFAGRDHSTNLAVLRVEGLEVEAATPAEGEARVGQLALAVGSTSSHGEGPRATLGIVSAVGGPVRTWRGPRLERYIQTDATPYPGFSGGPLIDVGGKVLGIMVSGSRGTAFAVPADLAWRVAGALEERGSVKRGYLGILSQPVRLPDGQRLGLTQKGGLLVVGVEDGSPAGRGGLIIGDILATLDGQPVEDTDDLLVLLGGERVGRAVPVKLVRGGELEELEITVGERG